MHSCFSPAEIRSPKKKDPFQIQLNLTHNNLLLSPNFSMASLAPLFRVGSFHPFINVNAWVYTTSRENRRISDGGCRIILMSC